MTRRRWGLREMTADMVMTMRDHDGLEQFRGEVEERSMRVTLAPGQRFPAKKGQAAEVRIVAPGMTGTFVGRVRFRRLNVAVIDGRFEEDLA